MADNQSHISFSIVVAIGYAVVGGYWFGIYPEYLLLASVIVFIAGMLPNIDQAGGSPERELGGLLAAVAPILVLQFYPQIETGGMPRVALVVVCAYLITRVFVVRLIEKVTVHRGAMHSIPAAIITFQLVYLLFWDTYFVDRVYLAGGAFLGFMSHLLQDAYGNFDIVGTAMGNPKKKQSVLKLGGATMASTIGLYGCMGVLTYVIAQEFYPQLPKFF